MAKDSIEVLKMDIKVNNTKFNLTDDGITINQEQLVLKLKNPDKSLDEIEDIFYENKQKFKIYENEIEINSIRGYTELISVAKDLETKNVTVTLMQPTLIIKGYSSVEQVKRLIKKEGYDIEG